LLSRAVLLAPLVGIVALAGALGSGREGDASAASTNANGLPNIVVVMSDDQEAASIRVMDNVQRLLGREGTTFRESYVSYSLCCPSRATFLTGQYAHNHGVLDNAPPAGGYRKLDHTNTLPVWLQRAGYHTAHIGKYMNGYGSRGLTEIPPGWSEWNGAFGAMYFGYRLNENGTLVQYGGTPNDYNTDVFARKAVDFVRRQAPSPTPFFLNVAPNAPHETGPDPPGRCAASAKPAPRHIGRFENEPLPMSPSFNETDDSDKPINIRRRPPLNAAEIANLVRLNRCRLESLLAIDEGVRDIINALGETGELDDTLIIYTSDNGFFLGEHHIRTGKFYPYEESIRVPLLIRGPGVPRGKSVRDVVANVDLAPTILDAANGSAGRRMDGRSLFPLMTHRGERVGRAIMLETGKPGWSNYTGLRTHRYMYAEYASGDKELYDLAHDRFQLRSVHNEAAYGGARAALAGYLGRIRACSAGACRERPRVSLRLRYRSGRIKGKRCVRGRLRARIRGHDGSIERVKFSVGGRRAARDSKRPFRRGIRRGRLKRGRKSTIRALLQLVDGRELTLDRKARGCGR
jgi:N-acetylglucosamine-6-sulfatase